MLPSKPEIRNNHVWQIGLDNISVTAERLNMLVTGGLTSDNIMDGFFATLIQDLLDADPALTRSALPIAVTDSIFGHDLVQAKRNPKGMGPPAKSNARLGERVGWFEEVCYIFSYRLPYQMTFAAVQHL